MAKAVADRHGISAGLLLTWRKQMLATAVLGFTPVQVVPETMAVTPFAPAEPLAIAGSAAAMEPSPGVLELNLLCGTRIRPNSHHLQPGQERDQRLGLAADLCLPDNPAPGVHHADARELERNIDTDVVLHGRFSTMPATGSASHRQATAPWRTASLTAGSGPLPDLKAGFGSVIAGQRLGQRRVDGPVPLSCARDDVSHHEQDDHRGAGRDQDQEDHPRRTTAPVGAVGAPEGAPVRPVRVHDAPVRLHPPAPLRTLGSGEVAELRGIGHAVELLRFRKAVQAAAAVGRPVEGLTRGLRTAGPVPHSAPRAQVGVVPVAQLARADVAHRTRQLREFGRGGAGPGGTGRDETGNGEQARQAREHRPLGEARLHRKSAFGGVVLFPGRQVGPGGGFAAHADGGDRVPGARRQGAGGQVDVCLAAVARSRTQRRSKEPRWTSVPPG